jgi:molybdate transport system ATP-binding protein
MYQWKECTYNTPDRQVFFTIKKLTLPDHFYVTFVGANGSGKTLLARALEGELKLLFGNAPSGLKISSISFEKQIKLMEEDFERRNSDDPRAETGFTPREMFAAISDDTQEISRLCDILNFSYALDRSYHKLSSGEGRKTLIIEALLKKPDIILLDSPFDGLDPAARKELQDLLTRIYDAGASVIVNTNRFEEISPRSEYLGLVMSRDLARFGYRDEILEDSSVKQLTHYEKLPKICALPRVPLDCQIPLDRSQPLIVMKDVTVAYGDHVILNKLSWTVNPYEHWEISGPNGCGKSTLLSLVTGDNPQSYCNDITLFGIKRGSGESIWDIKKHIGYVSPAFHLDYRISSPVINVILSGYFDSVGLYEQPGDEKISLARQWLSLLGLSAYENASFRSLSFGQQRLLLIVRALVKQPPLLILDEPLQGLDGLGRELVRRFAEFLMQNGETQILFVSHHEGDAPRGIGKRLIFTDNGTRTFDVKIEIVPK